MFRPFLAIALAGLMAASAPLAAAQNRAPSGDAAAALAALNVDIPYTKYVLDNGLTLIVNTDATAPVVHFNVWYHVGAKDEPEGQTGFAHLFEHLMFNGSENFNDDFFKATRALGATEQNGTTSNDRTNYFQTVPKEALDSILWLESDRMGHFVGVIDEARVDEQRGVVQNEKRQGDNEPYAIAQDLQIRATYPKGHPYDHSVIGSMEDLDAASVEQVQDWFKKYYGPSNAVVVLSGDITPEEALAKVKQYFGWIPPGEPVAHPQAWIVKRTGEQREIAYDRVAQPLLTKVWGIPYFGHEESARLDVFANLLAADRTSRLTKRLVYDEQLATEVTAYASEREIAGDFGVDVYGKPGADMARIEQIIDEEMAKLINEGPTADELAKVRARYVANQVRSLESITAKATTLAQSQVFLDSPDGWKRLFNIYRTATGPEIQAVAKKWLTDGSYTLTILPFEYQAAGVDVDRSTFPEPGDIAEASFPDVRRATLSNGLKVVLAERHQAPLVTMDLLFDTGFSSDFASIKPGTGELATALLDEGAGGRDAITLADQLIRIGAELSVSTTTSAEMSVVSLSALKPTLDEALGLFSDVALRPNYAQADVDRVKAQMIAALRSGRLDPPTIARRVLAQQLYGDNHPYGRITTEAGLASITREEVAAFHRRWFAPQNATLVVAGDITLAELTAKLEAAFAGWTNTGSVRRAAVPPMPARTAPTIYLVDRPGSPQSFILAGLPAAARDPNSDLQYALDGFNTSFGGDFTSRINMNLRENKGWSYGVSAGFSARRGPREYRILAQVQTDKTAESIGELRKELTEALSSRPLTPEEVAANQKNIIMGLASDWQTQAGIVSYLNQIVTYGLPDDFYDHYAAKTEGVTAAQALSAAKGLLPNQNFAWAVVGDRAKIETSLRGLGLDVVVVDADGQPVR